MRYWSNTVYNVNVVPVEMTLFTVYNVTVVLVEITLFTLYNVNGVHGV